jgi:hypothetical protein
VVASSLSYYCEVTGLFPKIEGQSFVDYLFPELFVAKYWLKKLGTLPVSLRPFCSVGSYEQCLVDKMFTALMTGK